MATVNKIEAASRQLDTAIHLFFSGGDSISIHTLATGAENIFADISDHTLGHSWRSRVRDDHGLSEQQLRATFRREWNFFKHADNDPEGTLEFNDSITDQAYAPLLGFCL